MGDGIQRKSVVRQTARLQTVRLSASPQKDRRSKAPLLIAAVLGAVSLFQLAGSGGGRASGVRTDGSGAGLESAAHVAPAAQPAALAVAPAVPAPVAQDPAQLKLQNDLNRFREELATNLLDRKRAKLRAANERPANAAAEPADAAQVGVVDASPQSSAAEIEAAHLAAMEKIARQPAWMNQLAELESRAAELRPQVEAQEQANRDAEDLAWQSRKQFAVRRSKQQITLMNDKSYFSAMDNAGAERTIAQAGGQCQNKTPGPCPLCGSGCCAWFAGRLARGER